MIFLVIFGILCFLVEKLLRKWLGIEKRKISETTGKNIDRLGRVIILIAFLCTFPFTFALTEDLNAMKWYWILYLVLLLGFQGFVQWRYLKNSREYVITLVFLVIGAIAIYSMDYFI
ncbi:DUF4181 domain-containing protein [Domibacillus robiginosus]|uniref:DUF4181 domain-containing protein n=1 Tax=Domibacillus robiginosus TaxID=1071054 RepID=UPI00316AC59B